MKKVFCVFSIVLAIIMNSCSEIVCGQLDKENQQMVDSVNANYADLLTVDPIPCEFRYINIFLRKDTINKAVIDSVHKILYKSSNTGWTTLDVYDSRKNYIYSHGLKGNIYQRSGD